MKHPLYLAAFAVVAFAAPVSAQTKPALTVTAVEGIGKDGYIEPDYAFCIPAEQGHMKEGPDKSIGLAWSKGPEGTRSYAIIGVDADVPTVFDDAGKEGKTLPATMPRKNFYHWVLFDIPADTLQIPANTDSNGIVQHGKTVLKTPYGMRGVNDYQSYMEKNPDRRGVYAGYDGPCPPWNDERIHHYHFKVYALDVKTLDLQASGLTAEVSGPQAEAALAPHILASGEVVGKYTLNPEVKK
jgi:hypothetical protein